MAMGNAYEAGFHMGQAAHLVEDSHASGHALRDSGGMVTQIGVYSAQSPERHAAADDPGSTAPSYRNAVSATRSMIGMFRNGSLTAERAAGFFPLSPRANVGTAGATPPPNTPR